MKKILLYSLLFVFFSGCDNSFRIEKRHYMKGYYLASSKKEKAVSEKTDSPARVLNDSRTEKEKSAEIPTVEYIKPEDSVRIIPTTEIAIENQSHSLKLPLVEKKERKSHQGKSSTITESGPQKPNTIPLGESALVMTAMGLAFAGAYKYRKEKLLKISNWGKRNKKTALFTTIAAKLGFVLGGVASGYQLYQCDYEFSKHSSIAFAGIYLLGLITYPFRKSSNNEFSSYLRRKLSSFVLFVSGLFMAMSIGNHRAAEHRPMFAVQQEIPVSNQPHRLLEKVLQSNDSPDETSNTKALRTFLTVLTIIFMVALAIVVVALSCVLACDNEGLLALLVLFGGAAIIAVGTVYSIRGIRKIMSPEEKEERTKMKEQEGKTKESKKKRKEKLDE